MLLVLAALLGTAAAQDEPSWVLRQQVAVAGFPTGLMSDTRFSVMTPLTRNDSIVFQSTYARAGVRAIVTPAFSEVGPRIGIAPIDVFDVEAHVMAVSWYSKSVGMLPFDTVANTRARERNARDDGFATTGIVTFVNPTVKVKVGPVIIFDTFTWRHLRIKQPDGVTSEFTYEPFDDLVVGWTDHTFDHQAAALYEIKHSDEGPSYRVGLTWRDKWAHASGQRNMTAGAMAAIRPGNPPAWPTFVLFATPYLIHPDQPMGTPYLALATIWNFDGAL
ncbi:MAG: hypothetical protein KC912_04060 [Proteobacteria bacterium]|nr:hypothetical protein [Pseudomonadota bacterium]